MIFNKIFLIFLFNIYIYFIKNFKNFKAYKIFILIIIALGILPHVIVWVTSKHLIKINISIIYH